MRFAKFVITNYRAIEHMEVSVGKSLIPIIGINESGKTSILKAILSFDRSKDSYNKGEHLNYKNRYKIGKDTCYVKAEIYLDKDDDTRILDQVKIRSDSPVVEFLKKTCDQQNPITVSRNLETREYSVEGSDVDGSANRKLADAICKQLPYILYFDDFSDRVPDTIVFPHDYSESLYTLKKSKALEWQELTEEIFRRSTQGKFELRDFLNMKDSNDQFSLCSDVSDTLDDEIIGEWKKLKAKGSRFADDEADLKLRIEYVPPKSNADYELRFKVIDNSLGKDRQFSVAERSKGFQWFFNFFVKLKFNAKYKTHTSGAIYLLDEPGSYLHSSAQEELLRTIGEISSTNTIIYCTHSQYLLNPEVVNVASIRIAEKEQGEISLKPFASSGTVNSQGALTPVYDALHLRVGIGSSPTEKIVITEGITDYYFLKMLLNHTELLKLDEDLSIVPGAGASQLQDLISFSIAWAAKYAVLLDSDKAGENAYRQYRKYFGDQEADSFHRYRTTATQSGITLESFLSPADAARLKAVTKTGDIKTGIVTIFFMDELTKNEYFRNLDQDTVSRLSILVSFLNQRFPKAPQ